MGWAVGYDHNHDRDIGYGVPAFCDHPACRKKIDRGLAYVCGGEPYGGDEGCGLHFCSSHLWIGRGRQVCDRCKHRREPFQGKSDHPDWVRHKATDPSWADWRRTQPRDAWLRFRVSFRDPLYQVTGLIVELQLLPTPSLMTRREEGCMTIAALTWRAGLGRSPQGRWRRWSHAFSDASKIATRLAELAR